MCVEGILSSCIREIIPIPPRLTCVLVVIAGIVTEENFICVSKIIVLVGADLREHLSLNYPMWHTGSSMMIRKYR